MPTLLICYVGQLSFPVIYVYEQTIGNIWRHQEKMPPYRDTKPGDIGFEPILTESESVVLPLDESP